MRIPIWLTLAAALVVFGAVIVAGQVLVQPNLPLITSASFLPEIISPNADGDDDVTRFSYSISRPALVSLIFVSEDGTEFVYRHKQSRASNDYNVDFGGVVAGFVLPDEVIAGEVVERLMPDGIYTWRLVAEGTERDEAQEVNGTLTIENGDPQLPDMTIFDVAPTTFTPNQDSIRDRVAINVYLEKNANLTVYLIGLNGEQIFIPERKEETLNDEAKRHLFDYDGGVDLNADPPPDGTYTVYAEARDDEGQLIRRTAELTIESGGKPLAEIVPQTVGVDVIFDVMAYDDKYLSTEEQLGEFVPRPDDPNALTVTSLNVPIGDMIVFMLTVENYSKVPIRTSGPPPGTVYQQGQRDATLGWYEEAGAWRVGINCTTAKSDYPWRWAIGNRDDLLMIPDPDTGQEQYYLPPGERSVVWGAVRLTEIEARNPQNCWAGLIHEQVEVSPRNSNVGTREVEIIDAQSSGN